MFACKKEESLQEDEYFVKYIIESQTIYLGVQLNTVVSDEKNLLKSLLINTGKWETTIGPVKKGFQATLQTTKKGWTGTPENHLKLALSIMVSKNNGPFALRTIDDNTTPRATASIATVVE
jgi:hypothetical protein